MWSAACCACTFSVRNFDCVLRRSGSNCTCATLALAGLQLTTLNPGVLDNLAVQSIDLSGNMLSSIDEGVFTAIALYCAPLSYCYACMQQYVSLNLAGNKTANLSAGVFAGLPMLTSLDVSNNLLSSLPVSLFASNSLIQTLAL